MTRIREEEDCQHRDRRGRLECLGGMAGSASEGFEANEAMKVVNWVNVSESSGTGLLGWFQIKSC